MSWMLPNLCQLQQRSLLEAEWINKSWASSSINRITILLIFMLWIVRIEVTSPFSIDWFPSHSPRLSRDWNTCGVVHLNYYPKLLFHTLGIQLQVSSESFIGSSRPKRQYMLWGLKRSATCCHMSAHSKASHTKQPSEIIQRNGPSTNLIVDAYSISKQESGCV